MIGGEFVVRQVGRRTADPGQVVAEALLLLDLGGGAIEPLRRSLSGVFGGATRPNHVSIRTSGSPYSAVVGTSG